jgi:hypothetical protein
MGVAAGCLFRFGGSEQAEIRRGEEKGGGRKTLKASVVETISPKP